MAVERARQPLCIRYDFATRLTPGQHLDTAQPEVIATLASGVE
jgi:hypothetical protein